MAYRRVGLDSQCLSYLLDAIEQITEPVDAFAPEKKALIRSWLYMKESTFFVREKVMAEVAELRARERREFHQSFCADAFS